jgi:hypothetical protein
MWVPRPFRLLALDPGGTTGWASCEFHGLDVTTPKLEDFHFNCGQLGPEEHHKELFTFLTDRVTSHDQLICESFEFRQHINASGAKTKVELISKEYIGVVKLFSELIDCPVYFQTASAGKNFIPDKGPQANVKIKQLDLYKPISTHVHAMDAMRHLLRHMVVTMRIREPITDKWLED